MSKERLPFSVAYLSSLGLTLYLALGVRHIINRPVPLDHANEWFLATFIFGVFDWCRDSSHCACLIRSSLFPWRLTNITLWRSDGAPRCRIPAPRLTRRMSLHLYPTSLIVPIANITHCEHASARPNSVLNVDNQAEIKAIRSELTKLGNI